MCGSPLCRRRGREGEAEMDGGGGGRGDEQIKIGQPVLGDN